jgi:hypothetical protein
VNDIIILTQGATSCAPRSSDRLYDPRRRLPEMPRIRTGGLDMLGWIDWLDSSALFAIFPIPPVVFCRPQALRFHPLSSAFIRFHPLALYVHRALKLPARFGPHHLRLEMENRIFSLWTGSGCPLHVALSRGTLQPRGNRQ